MAVGSFGIEKESLKELLREASIGKAQLPDFQRGWDIGSYGGPAGLGKN